MSFTRTFRPMQGQLVGIKHSGHNVSISSRLMTQVCGALRTPRKNKKTKRMLKLRLRVFIYSFIVEILLGQEFGEGKVQYLIKEIILPICLDSRRTYLPNGDHTFLNSGACTYAGMCNLHPGQRIDFLDQNHFSCCDWPFRDTANFESIMTVCVASHTYFIGHFNKLFGSQMDMVELLLYLFLVTYLARIKTFSHLPIKCYKHGRR